MEVRIQKCCQSLIIVECKWMRLLHDIRTLFKWTRAAANEEFVALMRGWDGCTWTLENSMGCLTRMRDPPYLSGLSGHSCYYLRWMK